MPDALVLQWAPAPKRLTLQWLSHVGELPAIRPDLPLPTLPAVIGPQGPRGEAGAADIPPVLDGGNF